MSRPRDDLSRSARAAQVAFDERISFGDAGARFGLTREAVRVAYRNRYGQIPTPMQRRRSDGLRQAVAMARAGASKEAIIKETGLTAKYLGRMKVRASSEFYISSEDITVASDAVRAGASYAEAAAKVGRRAPHRLAEKLRAAGVVSTATNADRMDGRSLRARARVEAGATVSDACRAEGCASGPVYAYFSTGGRRRKP